MEPDFAGYRQVKQVKYESKQPMSAPNEPGLGSRKRIVSTKEVKPTTWYRVNVDRGSGMPPPERMVRHRNACNELPPTRMMNRGAGDMRANPTTSLHSATPLRGSNAQQSTSLTPYLPVGGTDAAQRLRRPGMLTPDGNFEIMSTANANARRRAECRSHRAEAMA